ncbi:MAG: hypothetical protein KDI79_29110 [Anaerolineae bacterium]|nr:hypothetical protein [Anaerolineae bacterium]
MATKILTGVLIPKQGFQINGNAVILFNPFMVAGDANGVDLNQTGQGAFTEPPTKKITIHQVRVSDEATPGDKDLGIINFTDGAPNLKYLTVDWNTNGNTEIRALSFLIMGEVED